MFRKPFLNAIVATSLLLSLLSMGTPPPTAALELPGSPSPILLTQSPPRQPQALPDKMPVFAFMPTQINQDVILGNAGKFNNIGATEVLSEKSSRGGLDHYFAVNPQDGTIVDQFNHTGGLFAVNASRAFTETLLGPSPTNTDICLFLSNRQLFPDGSVEPQYTDCRGNPPYVVKPIHLATVMPNGTEPSDSIIGNLVQVPLALNLPDPSGAPNFIPIGGPGGHLSLVIAGAVGTPSLDSNLPGLQALASPLFERTRMAEPIGLYPVVPLPVAIQRFKASFPESVQVHAGTPEMIYYVGFPDAPQDAMMPTWTFPDATAIISGTQVNLKESTLPGVDGFAPNVSIISPTDGTVIPPGQNVSITFNITGDAEPFTYTISSDDSVVKSGLTISGTVTLDLGVLPPFENRPQGHILSVHAVNSYNQPGDDTVFLGSPTIYLPLAMRSGAALASAVQPALQPAIPSSPAAPDALMRIGVEWVMNYHNPDLNLGQTKPDAEGLYNWLGGNGWARSFNYGNDSAWEKDWRDCTLGGIDCSIGVDRAEFVYFSGHGSPASFYFGVNRDYGGAWGGNSRFQNVRWAGFSSCQTLRAGPYVGPGNPPLTDWFNSFQGSYMLLGFHSNMGDVPFGSNFGFNMTNIVYNFFPWMQPSIAQAWVNTAFQMNAGKPAYLYAVGNFNPENFKLPAYNTGPRPPLTGIYQFRWVWWDE
jgi:hypothetical protein